MLFNILFALEIKFNQTKQELRITISNGTLLHKQISTLGEIRVTRYRVKSKYKGRRKIAANIAWTEAANLSLQQFSSGKAVSYYPSFLKIINAEKISKQPLHIILFRLSKY